MRARIWAVVGLVGVVLIAQALWIPAKAMLAHYLIAEAYASSRSTGVAVAPWPWADTSPAGRLAVPKLDLERYVLADASPRSLAFGPGLVRGYGEGSGGLSLAGHRDTHFAFLGDLAVGDVVRWEDRHGSREFEITSRQIADTRKHRLLAPASNEMQLSTCWPLFDWEPRGPLRLLLTARELSSKPAQSQPASG